MELGLQNRVVLVTGSSSGIGRATALAFGREGARVGITYRSQQKQAEETARLVIEAGGQVVVVAYDLASEETMTQAVFVVILDPSFLNEGIWGNVPLTWVDTSRNGDQHDNTNDTH